MKKVILILLFLSSSIYAANIEYISGNISYNHVTGSCPFAKFEITVNIFTEQNTAGDSVLIYFGDGTQGYIQRSTSINIGNQITQNIYQATHIYNCGTYNIYYEDTINIPSTNNTSQSNQSIFFLSSDLILNPLYPHNSSYLQFNSPAVQISKNYPFYFNVVSSINNTLNYDSITHTLAPDNALSSYGIYVPSGVKINRTSGEIQWLNPDTIGSYTFIFITKMYKYGQTIGSSIHYYKFEVVNQNSSFLYDSINNIAVNQNNFKEIIYTSGNTYSFSVVYSDLAADSIKLKTHSIDFFTTDPTVAITPDSNFKNTLLFSWSPLAADERSFPYNFVLQSISYYPNDSVTNSYQTVSFISGLLNGVSEKNSFNNRQITIYPNPTSSILNLSDEHNQLQNATININNYLGQTIFTAPFTKQIDISTFASGMYFLTVQDKEIKITVKVVKE
jgi:hypothetical protein